VSPEQLQGRIDQISATLEAIRPGWAYLVAHMNERAQELTELLIAQDDEQTRGRLKALRELLNLPETLQQEREGISAGLASLQE
jgi:hypothetical protein